MPRKVMISAGEASGELYGAMLSRELKKRWPDVEISGIGGPRMQSEGVNLIAPISHVIGIVEVIKHLREIRTTLKAAGDFLRNEHPDVLVLIDYPDFNIALGKKAKELGIPILYYVSPQVWAWRKGRVRKIAALVNKMAVLFPFEVSCYENTGLDCEFVGHPIIETMGLGKPKEELKTGLGLDPSKGVISLLPGSRPNELNRHQYIIMEAVAKLNKRYPELQIVIPLAAGTAFPGVLPACAKIIHGSTTEVLACSEVAAVASGTATLETALLGTPMVVFYRISPVTYVLARMLTNVRFISLVNILSGKEVVKELLQSNANSDAVCEEIEHILENENYRNSMIRDLKKIREFMEGKTPSVRVASMVGELAQWSSL